MYGDQRRRARRLHGEAWASELELVAHASREVVGSSRDEPFERVGGIGAGLVADGGSGVAVVRRPRIDANAPGTTATGWIAGSFERLPCTLEQQPLLRIEQCGLT